MAARSGGAHDLMAPEDQQENAENCSDGSGATPPRPGGGSMSVRQRFPWVIGLAWFLLDTVCIIGALYAAVFATLRADTPFCDALGDRSGYLAAFLASWLAAALDQRLLASRRSDDLLPQLSSIVKAFLMALVGSVLLMAVFDRERLGRDFLFVFGMTALGLILLYRTAFRLNVWRLRLRGWGMSSAVIVGANDTAVYLVKLLRAHDQYGFHVDGFVENDANRLGIMKQLQVPYLGTIDSLERILVDRVVDAVFIALPVRSFYETIQQIAHLCEGVGVPVRFVADLFPFRVAPNRMWRLENMPLLSLTGVPRIEPRRLIQRVEDLAISSLLIAMLALPMLAIAALVKMESRGPILEPQHRIRRDGRHFRMYRFRCKETAASGAADPAAERRFTRLGEFLFRYDLDELPVLFNVWLGHMSVSEPKPPIAVGLDDSVLGLERVVRSTFKP